MKSEEIRKISKLLIKAYNNLGNELNEINEILRKELKKNKKSKGGLN